MNDILAILGSVEVEIEPHALCRFPVTTKVPIVEVRMQITFNIATKT